MAKRKWVEGPFGTGHWEDEYEAWETVAGLAVLVAIIAFGVFVGLSHAPQKQNTSSEEQPHVGCQQ